MCGERVVGDGHLEHWERVLNSCESLSDGCRRRHGCRILFLASDFLCQACHGRFLTLDIACLSNDEVEEWVARMQCATFPKRVDAARTFLAEERSRLRVRTEAMELASRAVAAGDDQRAAFAQFQELLDPNSFERSKV